MAGSESSDGQKYKMDQNPKIGKYHKYIRDLQKVELFTLVSHLETGEKPNAKTYKYKNDLLIKLLDQVPEFITDHETKKIYLECKVINGHHFVKARLNVENEADYEEYRPGRVMSNMIEIIDLYNKSKVTKTEEDLTDFVACEDFLENEAPQETPRSDNAALFKMCSDLSVALRNKNTMPSESRLEKLTKINLKNLKYDEDEGISIFLTNIETVAIGHNLTQDTDKIQLAISILSQTSKGARLCRLFKNKVLDNWAVFKEKLFLMENSSRKMFEKKFRNYKRGAEEPVAVLMAELTELYQRSEGYDDNHDLSERDLERIRDKFFGCLDISIARHARQACLQAGSFKRNEDVSELENIAKFCMELEEMEELNEKQTVMNVHTSKKDILSAEGHNELNNLKQMMNQQSQQMHQQMQQLMNITTDLANNQKTNSKPRNSRRFPSLDMKKLNGYCLNNILNKCKHGDSCHYKHGSVPTEVLDYVKSLRE